MKNLLHNRRFLIIITVVALVLVGLKIKRDGGLNLSSNTANGPVETVFVHVAKQFAVTVPAQWSVSEPVSGRQTFIYPTTGKVSGSDVVALLNQDVVIVETATNKKESFDALINEMKSNLEKSGSQVKVDSKEYNALPASLLTVTGPTSYQQILYNAPTIIVLTAKIDHPVFSDLTKSVTIDLSGYANDIAQVTTLTRQTKQDIATGNFSGMYRGASDGLKELKSEEEFGSLFKEVSVEFNNNVLIWGVFINSNGLGSAVNIINQDKISRRGSFYYLKNKDGYRLDAVRISGQIKYDQPATSPAADQTATQ